MEQKLMDKTDKAWVLAEEKIGKHNKEWDEFTKEWHTKEIEEMIRAICDKTKRVYEHTITPDITLYLRPNYIMLSSDLYGDIDNHIGTMGFCSHSDGAINTLKRYADKIQHCDYAMRALREHIPEVIEGITQKYKDITEKQMDEIDNVLEIFNAKEEPIKHIKVTVEWV